MRVPTIKVIGSYRFFFSSSDGNEPPHVHIQLSGQVAKFWLTPVEQAKSGRMPAHELRSIGRLVTEHRLEFLKAWYDFFGN